MYIEYDLKIGYFRDIYKFFIVILITLAGCFWFEMILTSDIEAGIIENSNSIINYFGFFFKGCYPKAQYPDKPFELPVMWFLFQTYLMFILGKYPLSEMNNNHGVSVLLKGKSRKGWYISKCVWTVVNVVTYYLTAYLTIVMYGLARGKSFEIEFIKVLEITDVDMYLVPNGQIKVKELILLFTLPIMVSITLGMVQLMLSVVISSLAGFVFCMVFLILSAFYMNIWLIGNMTMWMRLNVFSGGKINMAHSFIICAVLVVISILLGIAYFNSKDILIREND